MTSRLWTQRGSVAIVALWAIVVLSFFTIALGLGVRQKMLVFEKLNTKESIRLASESAIKKIMHETAEANSMTGEIATGSEWYYERMGKKQILSLADVSVEFVIEDENSKININKAPAYVLTNLFQVIAGLDREKSQSLAKAILDFRDPDDHISSEIGEIGSEDELYRKAGLPEGPKNGDFEWVSELLFVRGMNKDIYNFVEKYITIYGDGRVNINTCDKEILLALGLHPGLVERMTKMRLGPDSKDNTEDDLVFTDITKLIPSLQAEEEVPDSEAETYKHALIQRLIRVTSDQFHVRGFVSGVGPRGIGSFSCVYSVKDGVQYWWEG